MKTYIIKAALCSTVALTALTSCEFDQYPDTSIPTEKAWSTVLDATQFNNGLKSAARSICGGSYTAISELQSDLFNETTANWEGCSFGNIQDWTFTSGSSVCDNYWAGCYTVISNANNIINNIDKITPEEGNEEQAALLKYYKGSAYFVRALAYDKLARRYCKAYDKATAEETLGLPLVETVDVNEKPSRSSLKATYDFIKSDIAKAKELMGEDDIHNTDNGVPSYNAADALDARVSLNCQDYDNAIACAERTIAKYPLCTTDTELEEMWKNDQGTEIIFQPTQTKEERTNSYQYYILYSTKYRMQSPNNVPTQGLIDLYEDEDMRLYTYFAANGAVAGDIVDENVVTFKKFPGNPDLVKNRPESEFYNMTKELRVGEMYLIAAEASYMKDGSGLSYLNALRTKRGASALDVSGNMLLGQIKNEWAREMCGEGFRLDCLKRWGDGCKRMKAQNCVEGYLQSQPNYQDLNIPASNQKFVWEIPTNDLQANPNLKRNW